LQGRWRKLQSLRSPDFRQVTMYTLQCILNDQEF
jgi:hypothetical protein